MIIIDKKLKNQSGMALVMALLILTLIMVSALTFSQLIVNEVKMSTNVVNSVASFYSAESGMEKALYYLKYSVDKSDFKRFTALESVKYPIGASDQSFTVVSSTTSTVGFAAYKIATSSPVHVDLLDISGNVDSIDWGQGIGATYKYTINWTIEDCFPFHASDRLEVSKHSFDSQFNNAHYDKDIIVCDCEYASDQCAEDIAGYGIQDTKYYRFSFRPLDDAVESLEFDIKENGNSIGILSQIYIKVDGEYKNSQYRLKASLPAIGAVPNIFDYVIFSEEDIIKDI